MKLQAYRGVSFEYPENTLTALVAASEQGYQAIEVDVTATADDALVLMSDTCVAKLACNADGSAVTDSVRVGELTFEQLLGCDFGIRLGNKFKDTPVCILKEALVLAKRTGMEVQINPHSMTDTQLEKLYTVVEGWAAPVCLSFDTVQALIDARKRLPEAALAYRGPVTHAVLDRLSGMEKLTVWLTPDASDELARKITPFAALAMGPVVNYEQAERAEALGAEVVSTAGHVKNVMNRGVLADMHIHTSNSHDAFVPMLRMCQASVDAGVSIINIADHCDVFLCQDDPDTDIYSNMLDCYQEIKQVQAQLGDSCKILMGVEMGEAIWYPSQCAKVLKTVPYDCVVGSVHAMRCKYNTDAQGMQIAYSKFPWKDMTLEQAHEVFTIYFEDLLKMAKVADMDVVAHLTCVATYYNRLHETVVDLHRYEPIIRQILQVVIERRLALEVNTGSYLSLGITRAEDWILQIYREMGGYLITMATDSHGTKSAATGYPQVVQMLKDLGFRFMMYYEKRRSYQLTL